MIRDQNEDGPICINTEGSELMAKRMFIPQLPIGDRHMERLRGFSEFCFNRRIF